MDADGTRHPAYVGMSAGQHITVVRLLALILPWLIMVLAVFPHGLREGYATGGIAGWSRRLSSVKYRSEIFRMFSRCTGTPV